MSSRRRKEKSVNSEIYNKSAHNFDNERSKANRSSILDSRCYTYTVSAYILLDVFNSFEMRVDASSLGIFRLGWGIILIYESLSLMESNFIEMRYLLDVHYEIDVLILTH